MKKMRLLMGMLAVSAFVLAFTGCPQSPKSTPIEEANPGYTGEKKDKASGNYFSVEEDEAGLKLIVKDGVDIQKDTSHFEVSGTPFSISITADNIESNKKEYIFPFVEKARSYEVKLVASVKKAGSEGYEWITENLTCTAGGGSDCSTIVNIDALNSSKLSVRYEEGKFTGTLETQITEAADFIKDASAVKSAETGFAVFLGLSNYKNPYRWYVDTDDKIDFLAEDADSVVSKVKNGFEFKSWGNPSDAEWKEYNYYYTGLMSTSIIFNAYDDTVFKTVEIWSKENKYVSSDHQSVINLALNEKFPSVKLEANHPWINGNQDMSEISNYQTILDISTILEEFPVKGDVLNLTWSSISDIDVKKVYCRLVENSSAVENYWKELSNIDLSNPDDFILAKDIKFRESFQTSLSLKFEDYPKEKVQLCLWYEVGDAQGEATFSAESATTDVEGQYFTLKGVNNGVKITVAENLKVRDGINIYSQDLPVTVTIPDSKIEEVREFVFPFAQAGKEAKFMFGAFVSEDGGSNYTWKTETLKCVAGGGLNYKEVIDIDPLVDANLLVEFDAGKFTGKFETSADSISEIIKNESILKKAELQFNVVLGKTNWANTKWWGGSYDNIDFLLSGAEEKLAKIKESIDFWAGTPIESEWKSYGNQYCAYYEFKFALKDYDVEFSVSDLPWSNQMEYTSSVAVEHNPVRNIAIDELFSEIKMNENHPWIDGEQDLTVISNYQKDYLDITSLWGDDFPQKDDTLNITWNAVSDIDVSKVYCRVYDSSEAAGWWMELCCDGDFALQVPDYTDYAIATNIKAGEPFAGSVSVMFAKAPVAKVSLCIWYDVGDASGAATFKSSGRVIFNPATLGSVPSGEIVDIDGVKYWKVTPDGYNTSISIPEIDCSDAVSFKVMIKAEEAKSNYNLIVKVADSDWNDIATPSKQGVTTELSEISAGKAIKTDWNTVSETMKTKYIQLYVQDAENNWNAVSDSTVYIGKITVE